jgi:hypothetical protein
MEYLKEFSGENKDAEGRTAACGDASVQEKESREGSIAGG